MKIRLMLADDHTMFRETLRTFLNAESDMEVIAEASTGWETLNAVSKFQPDILVLDIALPDMNGIEIARRVLAGKTNTRIVTLSGYAESMFVCEMLKAGALAYVVKSAGTAELIHAIRTVFAGQSFLSPDVTGVAIRQLGGTSERPPVTVLGKRERDVLRELANGKSTADIATELGISPGTVSVHRRNIKHKLGLSSTADLTRYAIREGLQSV